MLRQDFNLIPLSRHWREYSALEGALSQFHCSLYLVLVIAQQHDHAALPPSRIDLSIRPLAALSGHLRRSENTSAWCSKIPRLDCRCKSGIKTGDTTKTKNRNQPRSLPTISSIDTHTRGWCVIVASSWRRLLSRRFSYFNLSRSFKAGRSFCGTRTLCQEALRVTVEVAKVYSRQSLPG